MYIHEQPLDVPAVPGHARLLSHLERAVRDEAGDEVPVRLAVNATDAQAYHCETGLIAGLDARRRETLPSMFRFRRRQAENAEGFTTVFLVPTGIGSTIGGHAGDATPAATLLASVSDTLITHPNVVNASDVIDLPANALYVEGSIVSRFLLGAIGLEPVRENRVLVVIDSQRGSQFESAAVNSVNAARSTYGLEAPRIVMLDPPVSVRAEYAASGRAAGRVDQLDGLLEVLDDARGDYDALALATVVQVPFEYHVSYFKSHGEMVNPWGGAEAIFTHAISTMYNVPAAHAPMLESKAVDDLDPGVVDPRMAAEAISTAFFMCVLKGLQRSPRIVGIEETLAAPPANVMTAEDVSVLVIPDKVVGVPTLAALEQGIPVIAVRENENILGNDLRALPWADGQLHIVENYWEAAGVAAALRAGIDPASVRRPLAGAMTELYANPAHAGVIVERVLSEAGR
ncbi:MAG: DUF3326 domain-containing protein [Gemmatimonadota bacterium]|nr:DUF3326 domain-containing protein [Gemmatimonadota bacterium]